MRSHGHTRRHLPPLHDAARDENTDVRVLHRFHDLRADGLDAAMVTDWLDSVFADRLVNRRSTTWRGLSGRERDAQGDDLVQLLIDHPTLVKRPVFVHDGVLAVGFKPTELREALGL